MVAAPRRVEQMETSDEEIQLASSKKSSSKSMKEDDGSDVKQVRATLNKNLWKEWSDDTTIFNSQVAATVNGAPILNGDVLDRYAGYLISIREAMQKMAENPKMLPPGQAVPNPEDYERVRETLIQRDIGSHVQKKLLVERMKSNLKPEQMKQMNEHIDQLFETEYSKLKRDLEATNKTELELKLRKKGTTLQNVRDNFALERLSMEYIVAKSDRADPIERPDLVAYYQSHKDEFAIPTKVRWQQIQVIVTPETSKVAARKKLEQAIAELEKGMAFEAVAKKYSDGPTAKEGGVWDWMEAGNLADAKLEKQLFSIPLKQLSEIHESPDSVSVVQVTARQPAGFKPFEDVQDAIYKTLDSEQNKKRPKRLFKELFSQAVIETAYSLPQFVPEE